MKQPHHILIATFPGQGHINPAIELAKRLMSIGLKVTFAIPTGAQSNMAKTHIPDGLSLATFSDGSDDGNNNVLNDFAHYVSQLSRRGSETFPEIIKENANKGHSISCIIYSPLVAWVAKVARKFQLPSIFLWDQPATIFDIYYYYQHGYKDKYEKLMNGDFDLINLPGLPPLSLYDLPSFFFPKHSEKHSFALERMKEHFDVLDEETNPKILVNTFDELENSALKSINNYELVGIGPLLTPPSSITVDGCIEWLDTKSESSVIYVSFGSLSMVSEAQMEEVAKALIEIDRPFLLVTKGNFRKELEGKGKIVEWCNQVEVLSHGSVGCFMTHCGWNSSIESLVSGVPVVALPLWTDQTTNSKMIQDFWKTGVRMVHDICDDNGVFTAQEIRNCLDMVMADTDQAKQMRNNAKKWKHSAIEALNETGSSHKNFKEFFMSSGVFG